MKKNIILTLSCLLLIIAGCKKEKNDTHSEEKPGLVFTKTTYTPYEVALLQADKDFTASEITATIEGNPVGISLLDSNRLGLLIPTLTSGEHTLVIESDIFRNSTLSFIIEDYTPVADAGQVITGYMDGFDGQIGQLEQLKENYNVNISAENINELKAMQMALSDAVAAATQEEKEALAQFIEVNQLMSFPMDNFPYRDSFYAKAAIDPGDELMALGKTFVFSTLAAAGVISVYVACASIPDPGITKIMALAAGSSALAVIIYGRHVLLERLTHCKGKAFDFVSEGIGLEKTTGTPIAFTKGGTIPIPDNMKFRNLQEKDVSESNYIHTIVSKIHTFAGYWQQIQDALAKLKSWFIKVPEKLSGGPVQFAEETYETFRAKQEYLSIGNVSDDRIQLAIIEEQGEKRIKATTTETLEEETPFSFDITYKHPELGNTVTKKIQAVYKNSNDSLLNKLIEYGPWIDMGINPDSATNPNPSKKYEAIHFTQTTMTISYVFGDGSLVPGYTPQTYCISLEGNKLEYTSCDGGVGGDYWYIISVSPTRLVVYYWLWNNEHYFIPYR